VPAVNTRSDAQRSRSVLVDAAGVIAITIFDERVVYDPIAFQHWSAARVTDQLTSAAAAALGIQV